MTLPPASTFKIGYAATAMPVRFAMEQQRWADAVALVPPSNARPEVTAVTHWAQAVAHARRGNVTAAQASLQELARCHDRLLAAKNAYWSSLVGFQVKEAQAWIAFAQKDSATALRLLREAADAEDALDKLPMTPGPVVPAREQLGDLLLTLGRASEAAREFQAALEYAPGRRNSLAGAKQAAAAAKAPARSQE